jgi:hypothetical protein
MKFGGDRLLKDIDLYRTNLDKIEQGRQMIADMVDAERKKRAQKEAALVSGATTEPASDTPDKV